MDEATNNQEPKDSKNEKLSPEDLIRIKKLSKSQRSEKAYGEDHTFWSDTFKLCKEVPQLLAEIDRLNTENEMLKNMHLSTSDRYETTYNEEDLKESDYECEF